MVKAPVASRLSQFFALTVAVALYASVLSAAPAPGDAVLEARQILASAGVKGGLIVHLGCGEGRLTAAFAGDVFLVQGLDRDGAKVEQARRRIEALGLFWARYLSIGSPGIICRTWTISCGSWSPKTSPVCRWRR